MEPETAKQDDAPDFGQVAQKAKASLEMLLRKTRTEYVRPIVLEAVLWMSATFVAILLSAGIVGALVPRTMGATVFLWIAGVGAAVLAVLALSTALMGWRRAPDLVWIAHLLQTAHPDFRNDIVAALQFADEVAMGATRYSRAMASEHVQRTLRALHAQANGKGSLAHLLPSRSLWPAVFALLGGLVMLGMIANLLPNFGGSVMREATMLAVSDVRPIVGDLYIDLDFPDYTHLPPAHESFSTGNIDAIAGTEVLIHTYAIMDVARVEIQLTPEGGDPRTIPVRLSESGQLQARFVATKSGTYKFRATLADGSVIDDGMDRRLILKPDLPPKVNVTSHTGEVEVSPNEVVEIAFLASDDYGLQSIARLYGFPGEEPKRVAPSIPALNEMPTELDAKMMFDLSSLNLQPKDTVVFQLEVIDNNILTGPGRTLSQELVFRVASPDDKHEKIVERQQQVVEALIGLLGDYLETPMGARELRGTTWVQTVDPEGTVAERKMHTTLAAALGKKTKELVDTMNVLASDIEKDPLMMERDAMIFKGVYIQLAELYQAHADTVGRLEPLLKSDGPTASQLQKLADHQIDMEEGLEKSILRLEDLLSSQRMEMIKATTAEIKDLKDRLRQLLEKYRDTPDPELKEAIKREIGRLRQRMNELMKRLQDQLQRLPQEHVNMDAVVQQQMESDAKKLKDAMTSIEDLLDQGDIDGALAALDQMDTSLDELTKQMGDEFDKAEPDSMSELDKKISELMDDVNDLEALQQDVEQRTVEAHQENLERVQKQLNEVVQDAIGPIIEDVREQKRALQQLKARSLSPHDREEVERAMSHLDELERGLHRSDIEQASEKASQSIEDIRSLEFSLELASRYTKPDSKASRDLEKSRGEMPGMISRGHDIRRGLNEIKDKARQQLASPDPKIVGQLGQGQKQVGEQAQQLSEKISKAGQEFPMLEQQMKPSANAARQKMGEAATKIGQGQLQPALDQQRQALEELRKLKESMRNTLQRQKQGTNGRRQRESVQIPEKDDRAKETYRDAVMKNMREGRLENYDDEIKRYYESLME